MRAFDAYKQSQNLPMTRIDLILAVYRKALDSLGKARAALADKKPDAARPFLLGAQMIVMGLTSELPAYKDEAAINFLRLYEFVSYQMVQGAIENVDAAEKVLRTLLIGFEKVRGEAVALEMQGKIPPLNQSRLVSLTA